MTFKVEFVDEDVNISDVRGEAISPYGRSEVKLNLSQYGGKGTFTPKTLGMHQVRIYHLNWAPVVVEGQGGILP